MGLLDLTTNLKSLKYGRDRRGGGSSKQPFIQTPIPETFEELDSNSADFLLKDGALVRGIRDTVRFSKFLTTIDGVLFLAKQTALSTQNPIVPGRPNRSTPIGGLYNPLLTVGQLAGNATGLHTERQGLLPITDSTVKYFSVYKNRFNTEGTNRLSILYNNKINPNPPTLPGTLVAAPLLSLNVDSNSPTLISYPGGEGGLRTNITIQNSTIRKNNVPQGESLETYQVGRGPFFGRGGLTIDENGLKFTGATADFFTYDEINGEVIPDPSREAIEQFTGFDQSGAQLKPYGPVGEYSTLSTDTKALDLSTYQIGRGPFFSRGGFKLGGEGINVVGASAVYFTFDEISGNVIGDPELELLTGINSEGQQNVSYGVMDDNSTLSTDTKGKVLKTYQVGLENSSTDRTNLPSAYNITGPNGQENIGANNPISYRAYAAKPGTSSDPIGLNVSNPSRNEELESQQICKFFFEIINNNTIGDSEFIYFRAYIDDIRDVYSGEWNDIKYSGRAEKFYQYKGFNRDISINFQLIAHTKDELEVMYQKLNKLTSMITPDYSDLGYMRGTIVKLTIGDYFKSLPGVVKGFDFSGHFDTGWELINGRQVPKYLQVGGFTFSPIHSFLPQKGSEFYNIASA